MTEPTVDSKRSPMNPGDDSSWHNILFPSCSSWISPEPLPPSSTPTGEATLVCRCLLSHSPIGQPVAAATSTSSPMTTPGLNITMPSLTIFHGLRLETRLRRQYFEFGFENSRARERYCFSLILFFWFLGWTQLAWIHNTYVPSSLVAPSIETAICRRT